MPFLSELDPRGRVKGSRDPLGFEIVWSDLGAKVVRNLTTITSSLESFATGILGHYFASLFAESHSDEKKILENFLRFEQLAAYSLIHYHNRNNRSDGPNVMGITRARQRYEKKNIFISADPEWQILSNQKGYGIWGLYTTALRRTGFLEDGTHRLTAKSKKIVEEIMRPMLEDVMAEIKQFTSNDGRLDVDDKHQLLTDKLAETLLYRENEIMEAFYIPLAQGGDDDSKCQKVLFEIVRDSGIHKLDNMRDFINELIHLTEKKGTRSAKQLESYLQAIRELENLLVVCSSIFDFLLSCDIDWTLDGAIKKIEEKKYDFNYLKPSLSNELARTIDSRTGDIQTGKTLESLKNALVARDYTSVVTLLLEHNGKVMQSRGGAPWISIEGVKKLKVRFPYEKAELPTADKIQSKWNNSYFLNSFKSVMATISRSPGEA